MCIIFTHIHTLLNIQFQLNVQWPGFASWMMTYNRIQSHWLSWVSMVLIMESFQRLFYMDPPGLEWSCEGEVHESDLTFLLTFGGWKSSFGRGPSSSRSLCMRPPHEWKRSAPKHHLWLHCKWPQHHQSHIHSSALRGRSIIVLTGVTSWSIPEVSKHITSLQVLLVFVTTSHATMAYSVRGYQAYQNSCHRIFVIGKYIYQISCKL